MSDTMSALTLQFLDWIDAAPRGYAETLDAWRSSCPRMPVWEDAIDNGLIVIDPVGAPSFAQARVRVTAAGHRLLDRAAR